MDSNERQVIDELFGKIRQAEVQSGPRDGSAESYIREQVARQPAAPYYMAQAIVVQEQALAASQARVQELEQQLAERPAGGGGFLSGLFGGGGSSRPASNPAMARQAMDPRVSGYMNPHGRPAHGGSSFLGGAMQTAMGVAGGLLLGNAVMSMFSDPASAAEAAATPPEEPADEPAMDEPMMDDEF